MEELDFSTKIHEGTGFKVSHVEICGSTQTSVFLLSAAQTRKGVTKSYLNGRNVDLESLT